jgi:hypothetical protein
MTESHQSAGGKARAQKLSKQERSDIARAAATARWSSSAPEASDQQADHRNERHYLQCGAAVIRNTISRLSQEDRKSFIVMLWPTLPDALCELIARFPDEARVNSSQLHLPASWYAITGVSKPVEKL